MRVEIGVLMVITIKKIGDAMRVELGLFNGDHN